MENPIIKLLSIGIRNIAEEPNEIARAQMLQAAALLFEAHGEPERAQQLSTTAAIIREAASAQLQLKSLFS